MCSNFYIEIWIFCDTNISDVFWIDINSKTGIKFSLIKSIKNNFKIIIENRITLTIIIEIIIRLCSIIILVTLALGLASTNKICWFDNWFKHEH